MSIQSEINRIAAAKAAIGAAIAGKGVTVPTGTTLDGMAALIESISTGGGGGYTNLIDTVGYSDGYRLSGSSGTAKAQSGCVTTGFIPITASGDIIRTSGVDFNEAGSANNSGWCYFGVYDNNQSLLGINSITPTTSHAANVSSICDADGNATITVNAGATLPGYIRLSGVGSGANLIVTKNEEIK